MLKSRCKRLDTPKGNFMNNKAKAVTITSRKGGVGKTAITSMLARYYSEVEKKQVLLIDFDARGGLTSLFYNRPITRSTSSIVELLSDVNQYVDPHRTFEIALIDTKIEKSRGWADDAGSIYLIPSKPALDDILYGKKRNLLKILLHQIEFPDDHVILIDSGPDNMNVHMAIGAADIVFVPMKFSPQDVHPTVETFQTILMAQKYSGQPVMGGIIINQNIRTQWEERYMENYQKIFKTFRENTNMDCTKANQFFHLKESRIILRGKHLEWSIRDEVFNPTREMAKVINDIDSVDLTENKNE
jgi:cellulose biosynthesis protein BcsQ